MSQPASRISGPFCPNTFGPKCPNTSGPFCPDIRRYPDPDIRIYPDRVVRISEYIRTALSGFPANKSRTNIDKLSRFSVVGNRKLFQTEFEKPDNHARESVGWLYDLISVLHVVTRETISRTERNYVSFEFVEWLVSRNEV